MKSPIIVGHILDDGTKITEEDLRRVLKREDAVEYVDSDDHNSFTMCIHKIMMEKECTVSDTGCSPGTSDRDYNILDAILLLTYRRLMDRPSQ